MATKSANILARVEPEVKEQAEEILSKLGIPASVVINMLYKQIIMTIYWLNFFSSRRADTGNYSLYCP